MLLYSEGTDNQIDVEFNGFLAKVLAALYLDKYLNYGQFGIAPISFKRWCLFFQINSGISHMTFFATVMVASLIQAQTWEALSHFHFLGTQLPPWKQAQASLLEDEKYLE